MDVKAELELLREYDADTGRETDHSLASNLEVEEQKVQSAGEAYEQMLATAGWKLLETSVRASIESLKDKIIDLEDEKEIRKHQAMVRAYSNVLGTVYTMISQARSLREAPAAKADNAE